MAKCPLPNRIRKPLNLTVSAGTHEYLKNAGFNVSRFVEEAVSAMKKGIKPAIVLVSSKGAQNGWAWSDSNRRSPPCKGFK